MLTTKRISIFVFILVITITSFAGSARANGAVDLTFNAQIQTTNYRSKIVYHLITLADGKTLAAGTFNNYNGTTVGGLIRLNADATLDTTFNNDTVLTGSDLFSITLQPDGKILLDGGNVSLSNGNVYNNSLLRLNADGSFDSSFNYSYTGNIYEVRIDASSRIMLSGYIRVVENGVPVFKDIIRLHDDGSIDNTFNAPAMSHCIERFTTQNNKYLFTCYDPPTQQARLSRLNEDGTSDATFTPTMLENNFGIGELRSQPDKKILVLSGYKLYRVNENGGIDGSFQSNVTFPPGQPKRIILQNDGRITIAYSAEYPDVMKIVRMLPNGSPDPSFTPYSFGDFFYGHTVQADGGILLGDVSLNSSSNKFTRLLPSGAVDTTFNAGGSGFQNINPGKIRVIKVLPNEKILIGGDFDKVNNIAQAKISRLNSDSTVDTSFQINTTATGNYFSQISDVYHFDVQSDGKILVSGNFTYVVNGTQTANVVRLNSNGSIDSTFNLSLHINDHFPSSNTGKNKPLRTANGKILIGTSRLSTVETVTIPLQLNDNGSKDTAFNPSIYTTTNNLLVFDTALQSDGKILVGGRFMTGDINQTIVKGFILRLNSNGTVDPTFQTVEILNKDVFAISVLANGKVLIAVRSNLQSEMRRLNADGTFDNSFNIGTGVNGVINAVSVLPNNKILVGGGFSTFNGEARQNLAMLDADGNLAESVGNINREVLCIAVDAQGRILIGGHFTAISSAAQNSNSVTGGAQQVSRSYLARLLVTSQTANKPYFDFDGDSKTDLSIFRPTGAQWWINNSSTNQTVAAQFGDSSDRLVPADFTGDGKTDIAFFRPSSGQWFILRSEDSSFYGYTFGQNGDIPTPGDYDGDGKADAAVFRPSNGAWYVLRSSGGVISQEFGTSTDKPVVADYDGDNKADIAITRINGANREWWIRRSSDGQVFAAAFGEAADRPVSGDYTGDGKADVAFFRPSNGYWYILRSEDYSFYGFPFGTTGDIPSPGDYDGDGKMDAAVYRPSNSGWYLQRSTAGFTGIIFGATGDVPLPSAKFQ